VCAGCARDTTTSRRAPVCSPAGPARDVHWSSRMAHARTYGTYYAVCAHRHAHRDNDVQHASTTRACRRDVEGAFIDTPLREPPSQGGGGGARTHQEEDGVRDGGTQGGGWEEGRDTTAPGGLTLVGLVPAAGDIRNTGGGGWGAGVNGRSTQVEARAGVHAQDKESGREGVDGGRGVEQKN